MLKASRSRHEIFFLHFVCNLVADRSIINNPNFSQTSLNANKNRLHSVSMFLCRDSSSAFMFSFDLILDAKMCNCLCSHHCHFSRVILFNCAYCSPPYLFTYDIAVVLSIRSKIYFIVMSVCELTFVLCTAMGPI